MSAHIPWDRLVDSWAGDLDAEEMERIDEHMFECAACAADVESVAAIVTALRSSIPAVVSAAQVDELRAKGLVVEENDFWPGTRQAVRFDPGVDLLVHRLGGLDLGSAERVQVTVRVESTGAILFEELFAPFDGVRGQVLIACQRHYASMPADILFEVRTIDASGTRPPVAFAIPHSFA